MSARIRLDGRTQRSFLFPAPLEDAFRYYTNITHILQFLPHITLLEELGNQRYRVLYHSTELNVYRVRLYCDLEAEISTENYTLVFRALEESSPVQAKAGLDWLVAPGWYSSTSVFSPREDGQTAVEYSLRLWADLPRPWGLGMLPNGTMNRIANAIAQYRIREVADGFIKRTTTDYLRQKGHATEA
ncbi:MAG: SRPBCC family protein [Anaerolineae bacterium]|nr:MAG: SRPBCC family protein [Anaerolineae bacterium]